jgi:hypothetical protein
MVYIPLPYGGLAAAQRSLRIVLTLHLALLLGLKMSTRQELLREYLVLVAQLEHQAAVSALSMQVAPASCAGFSA